LFHSWNSGDSSSMFSTQETLNASLATNFMWQGRTANLTRVQENASGSVRLKWHGRKWLAVRKTLRTKLLDTVRNHNWCQFAMRKCLGLNSRPLRIRFEWNRQ
jgi:hypothetical protein